jgi:hypothetical protein
MLDPSTVLRRVAFATAALAVPLAMGGPALAQNNSQLSGYVYVDRNNDGQLAFSDQALPELVIPNVTVELYSVSGATQTLLSSTLTNAVGQYSFNGLAAGTYLLRQIQPVEFVDGLDTLGSIRSLMGQPNPPGSSAGTAFNNAFSNILLPAGARGDLYNFGERGLAPAYVSKRFLLGSAPPPTFTPPGQPIPEPAGALLAALGSAALAGVAHRARRAA